MYTFTSHTHTHTSIISDKLNYNNLLLLFAMILKAFSSTTLLDGDYESLQQYLQFVWVVMYNKAGYPMKKNSILVYFMLVTAMSCKYITVCIKVAFRFYFWKIVLEIQLKHSIEEFSFQRNSSILLLTTF